MANELKRDVTSSGDEDALKRMSEIYKSRYFGVENLREIGKPVQAKIVKAITETLQDCMKGGRRITGGEKGVITVESASGRQYEIVLNKTSFTRLRNSWGLDISKWIGGQVVIKLGEVNKKEATLVEPAGGAAESIKQRILKKAEGTVQAIPETPTGHRSEERNPHAVPPSDDLSFDDKLIPDI